MYYTSSALAALCVRTLDNLQAEHLVTLDLREVESSPTDYFVICTANSDVHARALADSVARTADTAGFDRPKTEGRDTAEWALLDFFDVVVHIFRSEAREYYKLEKLWGDAPRVDIIKKAADDEKAQQQRDKETEAATKKAVKKPTAKAAAKTATKKTAKETAEEAVKETAKEKTAKKAPSKTITVKTKTTAAKAATTKAAATKTTAAKTPAKKAPSKTVAKSATAKTKTPAAKKTSP